MCTAAAVEVAMVEIAAWIRSGPGWQHYSLLKAVAAVAGYVVIAGRRRAARRGGGCLPQP